MTLFQQFPELLPLFRQGDRLALERVFRHYSLGVRLYLNRLGRSWSDLGQVSSIDDLHQEVFLRAFRAKARASYDSSKEYSPYLYRIARNCFVDAVRRRHRVPPLNSESQVEGLAAEVRDGEWGFDPLMLSAAECYLASLRPPIAAVYQLRFVAGLAQREACQTLGLTRRQLRTREEHLRRGLRRALAVRGFLDDSPH